MNEIDAFIYINLDHRTDRRQHIEKELARMGVDPSKVHRLPAFYETICGHLGCGLSHIKALELAVENKWSRIMIMEDDFSFLVSQEDFKLSLLEADTILWDVLLLARGHNNLGELIGRMRKVIYCTTASGYIIKSHYFETLLANFRESVKGTRQQLAQREVEFAKEGIPPTKFIHGVHAIDQTWTTLQLKDNFYIFDPVIGHQHPLGSDTF